VSDLQRLINWADQFASTIDNNVLIERAQSELGIFQQLSACDHTNRTHVGEETMTNITPTHQAALSTRALHLAHDAFTEAVDRGVTEIQALRIAIEVARNIQ
jgi:hypothetical protein